MKKRGQITIFLVLVVVIILAFEMFYYINSLDKPDIGKSIKKISEPNIVKNYAESCLRIAVKDALFELGLNESEKLDNYIIVEFENCLDVNVFEGMGINIEKPGKTNVNIDVSINKEDVSIKLVYPLDITTGETRTKLDSFRINLPIRLIELSETNDE